MKRKLIQQRESFTITLPKDWIEKFKLKAGDEINLDPANNQLVISAGGLKEKKEISIKITKENEFFLYSNLALMYRMGYDRITIEVYAPKVIEKIEEIVEKYLLGFGIAEKTKTNCIIENVTEPSEEKFDVLMRRLFLIIKETSQVVLSDMQAGEYKNLKKISDYRNQHDRYVFFCRRIISKRLLKEEHPGLNWELLVFLMHIEHGYHSLYRYLQKNKKFKVSRGTIKLFKEAEKYFDLFYHAHYKRDKEKLIEMKKTKDKLLYDESYGLMAKTTGPESVIVCHIREIIKFIVIGATPVFSSLV